jgi:glutamate-1-semialdehyde aminotransferase
VPARLIEIGEKLAGGFAECARKLDIPLQMIGPPSFPEPVFGEGDICDYRSYAATNRAAARQFGLELIKRDVFVHPASKMYISSVHDDEQIETASSAALAAMRVLRDRQLLS